MAITFYLGSGSSPSWYVWLALEHKGLPYEPRLLSFQKREHKAPAYLAVNPRGRVPAIVDEGFALYESAAIVEYLEQRYPERPLFPRDPRRAAVVRRLVQEAQSYFYEATDRLLTSTLYLPKDDGDPAQIAEARAGLAREVDRFEAYVEGDFLAGELSAADYALYPRLALARRVEKRRPHHGKIELGPKLAAWEKRIEALPYFDKTYPPHWREG